MILFREIILNDWRQFQNVDVRLDSSMTVLTGANGSGKTSVLNILSSHFGWNLNFVSTPFLSKKRKRRFFSDIRRIIEMEEPSNESIKVGEIHYNNDVQCDLLKPPQGNQNNPQYQLQYNNKQNVNGLNIPSHRPGITYQRIDQIPANPKTKQQHYQEFQNILLQTYGSQNVRNPGHILKQSLISLALFGYGNNAVVENPEYKKLFEEFQDILKIILPIELGFEKIEIRMPDVVLITKTGEFALDAMSGGISSLFDIAWQIHMFGSENQSSTVVIDEPENHLHPSMQRTLLPSLQSAFPNYRFIVATHSPFIVTSSPEAEVYAFLYNENRRVFSEHLDSSDLAGSPEKVLRDILDVRTTLPVWVEKKIREILVKYENMPESKEKVEKIYHEFKEAGISEGLSYL